jgi:periplasmic protein CpxP/Spy
MNTFRKTIVIAVASLGLGTAALAASDPAVSGAGGTQWGAPKDSAKFAEHMAKRAAALHDKLSLSPTQEPAWTAFTTKMQATFTPRTDTAPASTLTAPERADRMVASLQTAQQNAAVRAQIVKEFYAVLTPDQQKTFDAQFQRRRHHFGHG